MGFDTIEINLVYFTIYINLTIMKERKVKNNDNATGGGGL